MLSWVGRARCLPCLFLFMQFSSNELPKVTFEPHPGTEPSMRKICRPVQSRFCGRNGRASSERNSCREAAQSNPVTSLDAGMRLVPDAGRRWFGTSEFFR